MNIQNFLTEVAAAAIGGIVTIAAAYYLFKDEIKEYLKPQQHGLKPEPAVDRKEQHHQLLSLRLQAYERLILFVERISPSNLFIRVHQQGIGVAELQAILLNEIRSEYQHNVTQQLYIETSTWNVVRKLKDDTLAMINNAVHGLSETAQGVDLSRKVLQHMAEISDNPYDLTLELVKKDIHQLF